MLLAIIFACAVAAWFVSTIAAGGAVMLMMPVVGLMLAPSIIAPALSLGAFIANPSRAWIFRKWICWPVAVWLLSGSLVGAVLGAWLFTQVAGEWIQVLLGIFLLSTVAQYRFGKSRRSFPMKSWWFFPVGMAVAFLSGLIGGIGPIHNPFLLNYGLEKQRLVATKAINSLVMQLSKLITYTGFGVMTMETVTIGVVVGTGGGLGIWLASRHLLEIEAERFRSYTNAMMFIAGIALIAKGLSG